MAAQIPRVHDTNVGLRAQRQWNMCILLDKGSDKVRRGTGIKGSCSSLVFRGMKARSRLNARSGVNVPLLFLWCYDLIRRYLDKKTPLEGGAGSIRVAFIAGLNRTQPNAGHGDPALRSRRIIIGNSRVPWAYPLHYFWNLRWHARQDGTALMFPNTEGYYPESSILDARRHLIGVRSSAPESWFFKDKSFCNVQCT
ncbi:hypothetical protein CISG_06040 [Coccidioides immitis RMSCC 3703]|uniref:Uncharacterized protein n=2 Tax=Coccidioides immitis TaxID=5501 RepID=A0A0J8QXL9_COCIT|nr:hypothetical protein CIRG_02501 [Coccidioides immitis RMSCC 2394]KMU77196.1 hypothetical protein CISG_06040 [Coccidioides immitis RMSCC 3703]